MRAGNEFGNHLAEDKVGYYAKLSSEAFEEELQATTAAIELVPGACVRWFRAPQGVYTTQMRAVVNRHGLRHALGDAYCDDWAMTDSKYVSKTLAKQARPGSVIIMHMPERGFREHTYEALRELLEDLSARGLKCTTLTKLDQLVQDARLNEADARAGRA